jgi:hypothetical protein
MDIVAITELRHRYREALVAGEKYRELAETVPAWTDFYDALATTYERTAGSMALMLDKIERIAGVQSAVA